MSEISIKAVLLIEDNPGDARLLREMFNEHGSPDIELTHVKSMREAEAHLAKRPVDIILLDLGLPDAQGLGAVRRAHAAAPGVPLVVLTALEDESLAAQALQEGVQEHLIKGQVEARGLFRALRYAVERKSMDEALFEEKERPGHAQLYRRRRCEHGHLGKHYLPQSGRGKMTGWSWQKRPTAHN
jgi:CheY-like chemotaxis protein